MEGSHLCVIWVTLRYLPESMPLTYEAGMKSLSSWRRVSATFLKSVISFIVIQFQKASSHNITQNFSRRMAIKSESNI